MKTIAAVLSFLLLFSAQTAAAAEARAVRLRWADLDGLLRGKKVVVTTADGGRAKGRVRAVGPEAIEFSSGKTPAVERARVAEIRLVDYAGNARHFFKFAGGVGGGLFGVVGAVHFGLKEDAQHTKRNGALALLSLAGGIAAGVFGGWLLGREIDKEVTVIRIIPE